MVFETVRELISDCLGCDESRIRERTIILEDLEASPEDLAEVLMGVEEEFGVSFPDDCASRLPTVGDLVRYIEEQL